MEFCSRSPFCFGAQYPQQPPTSPSLAQTLGGCGCQNQQTGPPAASPHSSCTHGRKQPQREGSRSTSPCHSSPCCGAPEQSMHQAESVAALRAFLCSSRAKPTCYSAADHGLYPGEVHSFSGPQSPSQGPPNPVRHLLSR